ncbi:2-methylcitrate dehydratase PrpD [Sinosporangium album]|uniref:2-methylcitrate dehydratase PrpD n=1 Tax=Sinosporangium album TaxID=504805 RepID=A0A1G8FQF0_9ACTN|nr:MmgE/PrpD family protein [Sinosporangium album]SDH84351.1 2-methylcitrate dehydratase PrpD [Sinosporangium album]
MTDGAGGLPKVVFTGDEAASSTGEAVQMRDSSIGGLLAEPAGMTAATEGTANRLAAWAFRLTPSPDDLALAGRALADTLAVTLAARTDPIRAVLAGEPEALQWAALGHVLDFDDLHMPSTTHISVVCVPTVLACGGDARAYLAGAGVMARLGTALGWPHYTAGWHATCTAGAQAAAVAAGVALRLSETELATAIALALPAAGGVQRAFGAHAKSLQVGFAAHAGIRAARLAAAGATADPLAVDQWLRLVGGDPERLDTGGPAVPDGLAIKIFPCCYAMQRPIAAIQDLVGDGLAVERITRIRVSTPKATIAPLIHDRPTTGLQAKFSLPYAIAAALLDGHPGFASFTDAAVQRPAARRLVDMVEVSALPGGDGLLAGEVHIEVDLDDGTSRTVTLDQPPGAPARPPTAEQLAAKLADCAPDAHHQLTDLTWEAARELLRTAVPTHASNRMD